jgi:DNA polymerase-3 subunit epsilon
MNNNDLIQAITLRCETEIANPGKKSKAAMIASGILADEILAMIEKAGTATTILPRTLGQGLARLVRSRPLVIFDLETTSAQLDQARIIEIAAIKIHLDGSREIFHALINPGFDISAEIEELTSISNEELEVALPFAHYAPALLAFLVGCDVGGYNARNFDVPVLWDEFDREGLFWGVRQEEIVDAMEIFFKMEPRSLTGAVSHYLEADHSGAHRALPDAEATINVLDAQLAKYQDLPDDLGDLITETKRDSRIDMAGKFIIHNGVACFGFGKHGPEVGREPTACHTQRGYLKWMMAQQFPRHTLMIAESLYNESRAGEN